MLAGKSMGRRAVWCFTALLLLVLEGPQALPTDDIAVKDVCIADLYSPNCTLN